MATWKLQNEVVNGILYGTMEIVLVSTGKQGLITTTFKRGPTNAVKFDNVGGHKRGAKDGVYWVTDISAGSIDWDTMETDVENDYTANYAGNGLNPAVWAGNYKPIDDPNSHWHIWIKGHGFADKSDTIVDLERVPGTSFTISNDEMKNLINAQEIGPMSRDIEVTFRPTYLHVDYIQSTMVIDYDVFSIKIQ